MPKPILSPNVKLAAVENGYLAYDEVGQRLHRLNPFGALVVELCDGARSVEDIQELLQPLMLFGGQSDEISRWVQAGVDAGLLAWADAPPRVYSVEELPELAGRLRNQGEYEAAYLCQNRYAQSWPEDPTAWYELGDLAQRAGLRSQAAEAYGRYLPLCQEKAEIQHLLTALRDEPPPPRCPNECVKEIFDDFADYFDSRLLGKLKYQGPERICEMVDSVADKAAALRILDLGCGTGLSGAALKPRAARLVGVDLSVEMMEQARKRGIYDSLELSEITEWLGRADDPERFELVIACDALIYFGELEELTRLVAERLEPGGWFAFSAERSDRHPFSLTDSGRYAHNATYIREVAAKAGLVIVRMGQGFLRMEAGEEVVGLCVLLAKPGGSAVAGAH